MEIFLILVLLFLFVIAFPFLFEVRFYVNVFENFGMVTLKFCGIRVYFAKLKIKGKNIVIKTSRKRTSKEIEISTEKKSGKTSAALEMLETNELLQKQKKIFIELLAKTETAE